MPFNRPTPPQPSSANPEQLFGILPRTSAGVSTLWLHQGDVLRTYDQKFKNRADVAIELPTGTGKTLPGLLIADWNRRSRTARVVYACPTKQLVRQVMKAAKRQSVPAVNLSDSWRKWGAGDRLRFEQAEAIAVVTYSTIFNSNPQIRDIDTILFDDAHAGEQYVAGAYSMEIDREEDANVYEAVRDSLAGVLPAGISDRLRDNSADPALWSAVHLVLPGATDGLAAQLESEFSRLIEPKTELAYNLKTIRGHLDACAVYVSWRQILIRPIIPPTFENPVFIGARQRIYLSATLGDSGELERAFGRQAIERLPLPESAGSPRSGRRFLVFPTLAKGVNPEELARKLIARTNRAIVLSPSGFGVAAARSRLVPEGWTVFEKGDVEKGFDAFAATDQAVCLLANRYDGIDLPADACRAVALYGFPRATHLQEEFLSSRARATTAIAERIRARVIQGTGRCTRGPEDFALVIVVDADTTTYLARPEIQAVLDPALQAEVKFGLANATFTEAEIIENVDHFLQQDQIWQDNAEADIAELQAALSKTRSSFADALSDAVVHEVRASELAWQGVWVDASAEAAHAAQEMSGNDEVKSYRAFWLLMSGYYANVAARRGLGSSLDVADGYVKAALSAAQPQTWIREVTPFPDLPNEPLPPADWTAINAIASRLTGSFNASKNLAQVTEMKEGLRARKPSKFELALTTLGKLLGADAFKPDTPANCDSAWCWNNDMWLTLEAKSDETPDDALSVETVRQANTQLGALAVERGGASIPTPYAASVVVSPRSSIDSGAVVAAQRHVHLIGLADAVQLGDDVEAAWGELRQARNAKASAVPDLVAEILSRRKLLPTDVFERLTARPISND